MARVIISVSVTAEQAKFLQENFNINPSKILQTELSKLMECINDPEYIKDLIEENKRQKENLNRWKEMYFELKNHQELLELKSKEKLIGM